MTHTSIPGYTFGTAQVAPSPVTLDELERMKKSVLFGPEDEQALRLSREVLLDQTDAILDVWYGFVGANPQLLESFSAKDGGAPLGDYLGAVRKRFAQWILDTAEAHYDAKWLAYQHEIGLRHHRAKKNATDGARSTDLVPFRYLFLLAFPVTHTLKPFLAKKGHDAATVDAMYAAWVKSVLLQLTLWSHPYILRGDF